MSPIVRGGSKRPPEPPREPRAQLVRRFAEAFNTAAAADLGALAAVATPTAVAGYLVESHSGVVAPLASRTSVPAGARLEVDPRRVEESAPGLLVVPFRGHGFAREDFVGDAELHVEDDRVAKVVFRAP
jgi:hypothetical protein